MDLIGRTVVIPLLTLALVSGAMAAQPRPETIPEALARGASGRTRSAPSGVSPSIADIVADADIVVRGIIGESRSYLSDDQRNVYTDYVLTNPVVLYHSKALTARRPGAMTITVTQLGGKITVGNLEFTQIEMGLAALVPGTEGLFVLTRDKDRYRIAHTFYGAFRISQGRVMPLTTKEDFASEYRDASVAAVQEDLATRLRGRPQR